MLLCIEKLSRNGYVTCSYVTFYDASIYYSLMLMSYACMCVCVHAESRRSSCIQTKGVGCIRYWHVHMIMRCAYDSQMQVIVIIVPLLTVYVSVSFGAGRSRRQFTSSGHDVIGTRIMTPPADNLDSRALF